MEWNNRMKLLTSTIFIWWFLITIIFIFPYLLISIPFNAGFDVSNWSEHHRYYYVGLVCVTTMLSLGMIVLNELFKK